MISRTRLNIRHFRNSGDTQPQITAVESRQGVKQRKVPAAKAAAAATAAAAAAAAAAATSEEEKEKENAGAKSTSVTIRPTPGLHDLPALFDWRAIFCILHDRAGSLNPIGLWFWLHVAGIVLQWPHLVWLAHGLQIACCYLHWKRLVALHSSCEQTVKQVSERLAVSKHGMWQQGSEWWALAFVFFFIRLVLWDWPLELFHASCALVITLVAGHWGSYILVAHPKTKSTADIKTISRIKGVVMPGDETHAFAGGAHRRYAAGYEKVDLLPKGPFKNPDSHCEPGQTPKSELEAAINWSAVSYSWKEYEGGIALDTVRRAVTALRKHASARWSDPELPTALTLPWFVDCESCSELGPASNSNGSAEKEEEIKDEVVRSADLVYGSTNCKAHVYIVHELGDLAHHRVLTLYKIIGFIAACLMAGHFTEWRWALASSPLFLLALYLYIDNEGAKIPELLFGSGWSRCWVRRELMLSLPLRPTYVVYPHRETVIRVTARSPKTTHFWWSLMFFFSPNWMENISIPVHKVHGYWNFDSLFIQDAKTLLSQELGVEQTQIENMNAPWLFMQHPETKSPGWRLLLPGRFVAPLLTGGTVIHTPGPKQPLMLANVAPANLLTSTFGDIQPDSTQRHKGLRETFLALKKLRASDESKKVT